MPTVALVGRPNVGKSSLLNRIAGGRFATVYSEPGTTRDRTYARVNWRGRDFDVVDTGGLTSKKRGRTFSSDIAEQANAAIAESDLVVLVFDARSGLGDDDREALRVVRKSGKPFIGVVNKADNAKLEESLADYLKLGLKSLFPVSALAGRGIGDFLDEVVKRLPKKPPAAELKKTYFAAILGRPNVGKSSLMNALSGVKRSIVSEIPGTTIDAVQTQIDIEGVRFTLYDTVGVRKKKSHRSDLEFFGELRTARAIDASDLCVVVIDGQEGPTKEDQRLVEKTRELGKGLIIAVSKWDLAEKSEAEYLAQIRERFRFVPYALTIFTSSQMGFNIDGLKSAMLRVIDSLQIRVNAGELNNAIDTAVLKKQPHARMGKLVKIKYAAQLKTRPPVFVLYAKNSQLITAEYKRYIENSIRDRFEFAGVPLKIEVREKR